MAIAKIAILTSGGDAPGMNACIRAVVRAALQKDIQVFGILNGYEGMVNGDFIEMNTRSVGNIIHRGGTMLKSSRSKSFTTTAGRKSAFEQLQNRNIDAVVVIGGDGTCKGALQFTNEYAIPFVGIPGTIDNDLYGTDFTIGYDTAVQTAVDLIDKVRDTANSFGRVFCIEVMGRDVGSIALAAGLAAGAEDILIPELKTDIHELSLKLQNSRQKESYIVVVAEGDDAGGVLEIAAKFKQLHPDYDVKTLVLGHLLRGGSPSANDRILASRLGTAAVDALLNKNFNVMVGVEKNSICYTPLSQIRKHFVSINEEWKHLLDVLSY